MPSLLFSDPSIGSLRIQLSDPRLAASVQHELAKLSDLRFAYTGLALEKFQDAPHPNQYPYFFEWQQIEIFFEALDGNAFSPPYELRLNQQATALRTQESNSTHKLFGTLSLADSVGYTDIGIYDQKGEQVFLLEAEVFPQKLDYKTDFQFMLSEINQILHDLAYDYLRKTYALVEADPSKASNALDWLSVLKSLGQSLVQSLDLILRLPQHKILRSISIQPRERVKRVAPSALSSRWLLRNAAKAHSHLPALQRKPTFDTPENRFVFWATQQIVRQGEDLLPQLSEVDQSQLRQIFRRLRLRLEDPLWKELSPYQAGAYNSPVLRAALGYREFYLRYLLLQNALKLSDSGHFKLDYKRISTLYEYWCFLKLVQILRDDPRYELVGQELVHIRHDALRLRLAQGEESKLAFRRSGTEEYIHLWYNRKFAEAESNTFVQQPDIFIEFQKSGYQQAFRYVLDAKYRFDRRHEGKDDAYGPPREAIAQLHRYRDAILSNKSRKDTYTSALKSLGGIVLFPYPEAEENFRKHRFYQSYLSVNIGAIPLRPGPQASHQLLRDFLDQLLERPPEALYEEVIEYERADQRKAIAEMEAQVLIATLVDDAYYGERFRYYFDQKEFYVPWQAGGEQIQYLALYDQREGAIIGYGKVNQYEVLTQLQLERKDLPWSVRLRQNAYLSYHWEDWQSCYLAYPAMAAGGNLLSRKRALMLALAHNNATALALETYAWFRLWEEVVTIDPKCRLQKHEEGLSIRFEYQGQKLSLRQRADEQFFVMQPPSRKWVYDLKNPLQLWLRQHIQF